MHLSAGVASRSSLSRRLRFRKALSGRARYRVKTKTLCFGGKLNEGRRRSHERLLRYPNGDIRLIRYPATESEAEPEVMDSIKAENGPSAQHPSRPASATTPPKTSVSCFASPPLSFRDLPLQDLPSSPDELIRLIRSSSYIKAQKEHQRRIRESYQV